MTYVAKGTPPGYDVKTAADYLLSFNSQWPLLKVHETGTFSGDLSHSLGYVPFYIVTTADGRVDQFAGLNESCGVNGSTLFYGTLAGTRRYYIFRLDITTNYTAPTLASSTERTAENDGYVFKMTKPGKDVSSTDMRDFALHSNTKSPMLHKVVDQTLSIGGSGWVSTIPHGLNYVPTVFAFIKPGTNSNGFPSDRYMLLAPPVQGQIAYFTVDSTNVYITADGSVSNLGVPRVSIVVLKDPLIKEVVSIGYP